MQGYLDSFDIWWKFNHGPKYSSEEPDQIAHLLSPNQAEELATIYVKDIHVVVPPEANLARWKIETSTQNVDKDMPSSQALPLLT